NPDDSALWFHPRLAIGNDNEIVMTLQRHLARSDHYSGLSTMQTKDDGKHWEGPTQHAELDWITEPGGIDIAVADVTPGFHQPTDRFLAIGAQVRYDNDGKQL